MSLLWKISVPYFRGFSNFIRYGKSIHISPAVESSVDMNDVNKHAVNAWSSNTGSDIYEQTRPNYNNDSVEFLLQKIGALEHSESEPFTIVELGAGTGKFTRAVLKVFEKRSVENFKVISTEPIAQMCEKFQEMVPNIEILQRRADDLGLANSSADAVLAAQSFHWFANTKSVNEIYRILKPKGFLGLIWNVSDRSVSWIKTIWEMIDVVAKEKVIPRSRDQNWRQPIMDHGGFGILSDDKSYRYSMELDMQGVFERLKGTSFVSALEEHEREALLCEVEQKLRMNPEVKDKDKYSYEYVVHITWVQKN